MRSAPKLQDARFDARLGLGAPHQGAQARQQHARLDRLVDEVVGALLQARDFIVRIFARGQDQDRDVRMLADLAAHNHAVQAWQHQVEDHDVRRQFLEALERDVAAGDEVNREFVTGQVFGDELGQARIVFHQHYTVHSISPRSAIVAASAREWQILPEARQVITV